MSLESAWLFLRAYERQALSGIRAYVALLQEDIAHYCHGVRRCREFLRCSEGFVRGWETVSGLCGWGFFWGSVLGRVWLMLLRGIPLCKLLMPSCIAAPHQPLTVPNLPFSLNPERSPMSKGLSGLGVSPCLIVFGVSGHVTVQGRPQPLFTV